MNALMSDVSSSDTEKITDTKMTENEEDRLSSLPDDILINILSRIPIDIAASTSVLSHRWCNLWTGVTRFNLYPPASDDFSDIVDHILGQLTSPKLAEFQLKLSPPPIKIPEHDLLESCFRRVYDRFVEKVLIEFLYDVFYEGETRLCPFYDEIYPVPFCLLNSQSLVVLELIGDLKCGLELPGNGDLIHLPKLKKLKLDFLLHVPIWLATLIRFCPLLEDLHLLFKLDAVESEIADCVDILGPNLKSLKIGVLSVPSAKHTKMCIDAPKLETLEILDCYSSYYFVHDPSALVNACIDLRRHFVFVGDQLDTDYDFVGRMSEIFAGLSCASNLDLKLEYHTNILPFRDGIFPVFGNLTRFEIILPDISFNGWNDLLLSLQFCPNLKHLKVESMEVVRPPKPDPPNYVPSCFRSTLKAILIRGLDGIADDLKMLGYILCSASHLEQLHVHRRYRNRRYLDEREFCKSFFKLPRTSSTCEVVFSGWIITASSNTF